MLTGAVVTIAELLVIIFSRKLAEQTVKSQNRRWGFDFAGSEARTNRMVVLGVGVLAVILGVLWATGVIAPR